MALPSIDTAQTFTAIEDTNYTLAISDFTGEGTYTDGDDGTVINAIIIKSLPDVVFGVLKLDNVAVSIDQEITKTDIDAKPTGQHMKTFPYGQLRFRVQGKYVGPGRDDVF